MLEALDVARAIRFPEQSNTDICKSDREIEDVSAGWKEAMIEKGWSQHVSDTTID